MGTGNKSALNSNTKGKIVVEQHTTCTSLPEMRRTGGCGWSALHWGFAYVFHFVDGKTTDEHPYAVKWLGYGAPLKKSRYFKHNLDSRASSLAVTAMTRTSSYTLWQLHYVDPSRLNQHRIGEAGTDKSITAKFSYIQNQYWDTSISVMRSWPAERSPLTISIIKERLN